MEIFKSFYKQNCWYSSGTTSLEASHWNTMILDVNRQFVCSDSELLNQQTGEDLENGQIFLELPINHRGTC